jgi:hypothetical protein
MENGVRSEESPLLLARTCTLRGRTLDLELVVRAILASGPTAAFWVLHAAPGDGDAHHAPPATPHEPLTQQELELVRGMAMQDEATLRLMAAAGWEAAMRGATGPDPTSEPRQDTHTIAFYLALSLIVVVGFVVIGMLSA